MIDDATGAELVRDHPVPGFAGRCPGSSMRVVGVLGGRRARRGARGRGSALAPADGDADAPADGDADAPADGEAAGLRTGSRTGRQVGVGIGVAVAVGLGVAMTSVTNPAAPPSIANSRIATNTPTTPITKMADARSLTWTASWATVGGAAFAGGVVAALLALSTRGGGSSGRTGDCRLGVDGLGLVVELLLVNDLVGLVRLVHRFIGLGLFGLGHVDDSVGRGHLESRPRRPRRRRHRASRARPPPVPGAGAGSSSFATSGPGASGSRSSSVI